VGTECTNLSRIVRIFSRNHVDDLFVEVQRLNGQLDGFGFNVCISKNGNILVVTAPYVSGQSGNVDHIYIYTRGSNKPFELMQRLEHVACDTIFLAYSSLGIETTKTAIIVHVKSHKTVRSYELRCNCAIEEQYCSGFTTYPILVCRETRLPFIDDR